MLASACLHAGWSVLIKGSRHPTAFNVLQVLATVAVALALLPLFRPAEVPGPVWGLLAATGVAHALYFFWLGLALERGDLALVYPIARSTPAFVTLVAVPLLGEAIRAVGALGIAVVVAGMWLVHTGGALRASALLAPGAFFAYLTLAASVAYSLLDKQAMATLSAAPWSGPLPRAVCFYFLLSTASAALYLPLALARTGFGALRRLGGSEALRAVAASGVSFVGYVLILEALRSAPVSYVVTARQSSVLFALLFGALWLRERPPRPRVLGALATVLGVALIALAS